MRHPPVELFISGNVIVGIGLAGGILKGAKEKAFGSRERKGTEKSDRIEEAIRVIVQIYGIVGLARCALAHTQLRTISQFKHANRTPARLLRHVTRHIPLLHNPPCHINPLPLSPGYFCGAKSETQ